MAAPSVVSPKKCFGLSTRSALRQRRLFSGAPEGPCLLVHCLCSREPVDTNRKFGDKVITDFTKGGVRLVSGILVFLTFVGFLGIIHGTKISL